MSAFPVDFIWGTATSAHQVEGGNWNTDWWVWEHDPTSPCVEPSGDACDHYHRYPRDMRLLADLGFNAYRFSIEWARIEPEEGEFSHSAIDHYGRMVSTCRDLGLEPIVTLHHFTSPRWVASAGGWEEKATAERFGRYCEKVMEHLGPELNLVCTINEPNMPPLHGYQTGLFPPGKRDTEARKRASDTFGAAHRLAVEAIKGGPGNALAGMTLAMMDFQAEPGAETRRDEIRSLTEDMFIEIAEGDDFFGVQTYTRARVNEKGLMSPAEGVELTAMGWEFWPEALEATLRRAADLLPDVPLLVTENGIATDDDDRRVAYVTRALDGVLDCMADGIDVLGYCYWSAFDNFEWPFGYKPRYGLIEVDRTTMERTVKPSARWLGQVARSNSLATR